MPCVFSLARGRAMILLLIPAGAVALARCDGRSPVGPPPTELATGRMGGGGSAGIIIEEAVAHVHVGCTYGNFPAPILLDADLRFSMSGEYLLRAYPIAVGPTMPAQFAGVLRGDDVTLTVAVNDTIEKRLVVLGPVTVAFGREPNMGPCPICESPTHN